jgi:hypothetical protein
MLHRYLQSIVDRRITILSINQVCLLSSSMTRSIEHVRWSVLRKISIRWFLFSLFFLFILSIISRFCFCFSSIDFAWKLHDWSIWLRNIHLLTITSFDKLIFFFNLWIIIRIFQRLSSYLQQVINFYET